MSDFKYYNGKIQKIYNRNSSKTGYVQFSDIENVAKTDETNFFFYNNFFSYISVNNINGIAKSTFNFFEGLTENIQESISILRGIVTGITYNNGITTINNNLKTLDIESNLIQSNLFSSNTININKVNTDKIYTNILYSDNGYFNNIQCDNLICKDMIGIDLYINSKHYPLNKSILIYSIYTDNITDIKYTIKPKYRIKLYNNLTILYDYTNDSQDIKYYINITELNITHIKIYLNNFLLE